MLEQRPQVILHLGSHRDSNVGYSRMLEAELRGQLSQSPTSKVVYFAEAGDIAEGQSERLSKLVRKGTPPSLAMSQVFSGGTVEREIELFNRTGVGDFLVANLAVANRLHSEFPRRFGLATEHVTRQTKPLLDEHTKLSTQIASKAFSGDFDGALADYKRAIEILGVTTKDRDKTTARKIEAIIESTGAVVVARFGTGHMDIFHHLRAKGVDVVRKFEESPDHFPASLVLIRTMAKFPDRKLTELQWFQYMMADIYREIIIREIQEKRRRSIPDSEITKEAFAAALEEFGSMESVRKSEMRFRQTPLSR